MWTDKAEGEDATVERLTDTLEKLEKVALWKKCLVCKCED